jgi:hypothetical protein
MRHTKIRHGCGVEPGDERDEHNAHAVVAARPEGAFSIRED